MEMTQQKIPVKAYLSCRVSGDEKQQMERCAAEIGITESECVRLAVRRWLENAPTMDFLAGEVAALRGFLYGVASQLDGVTPEILATWQQRADAGKDAAAAARWQAYSAKVQKGTASGR
jgi:hypothetical protein